MNILRWLSGPTQPNATIKLAVQKTEYSLGELLKGEIEISSQEEFIAEQVFASLTCNEQIKKTRVYGNQYATRQEEYWDSAAIYKGGCQLFGPSKFTAGFYGKYPFSISISPAAKETLYSIDHYVKWNISATVENRGRPNIQTATYELQVRPPQTIQTPQAVTKEVHKEVVLIPCNYCTSLMPQSAIFCPNCGARRKT